MEKTKSNRKKTDCNNEAVNRSKKSLRISEREDFIRIADTEIVDKLVQDMYERLVFIAIKHDLPLDGIVSSSDTSKVMKRFTHDK